MKIANYIELALLLTITATVATSMGGLKATAMSGPTELSLMPVPASVQLQDGRLAITNAFAVATKGFADDRLRGGIDRMTRRLAGRTVITLPLDLATDENSATLVVQCERAGETIPSLNEDESYSLEVTGKQARLVAPTVVGPLRGLET